MDPPFLFLRNVLKVTWCWHHLRVLSHLRGHLYMMCPKDYGFEITLPMSVEVPVTKKCGQKPVVNSFTWSQTGMNSLYWISGSCHTTDINNAEGLWVICNKWIISSNVGKFHLLESKKLKSKITRCRKYIWLIGEVLSTSELCLCLRVHPGSQTQTCRSSPGTSLADQSWRYLVSEEAVRS